MTIPRERSGTRRRRWSRALGVAGGCLSAQVLQEFFVNATRKIAKPLSAETAKEIVADMSHWHVQVPAADDVLGAIGIHQRAGISFWDSMIVRSAAEIGCNVLYSEDLDTGQDYSGSVSGTLFSRRRPDGQSRIRLWTRARTELDPDRPRDAGEAA